MKEFYEHITILSPVLLFLFLFALCVHTGTGIISKPPNDCELAGGEEFLLHNQSGSRFVCVRKDAILNPKHRDD